LATYRLAAAGSKGSFTAKNATVIKLTSAVYQAAKNTVTLTLGKQTPAPTSDGMGPRRGPVRRSLRASPALGSYWKPAERLFEFQRSCS
jgi:hypothetical protein